MTMVASVKLTGAHGAGARACIVWDLQGKALVTAGADARLLVHNLGNPNEPPLAASVLHQKAVTALYMAPNGHTLASASLDKTVKLYSYPGPGGRKDLPGARLYPVEPTVDTTISQSCGCDQLRYTALMILHFMDCSGILRTILLRLLWKPCTFGVKFEGDITRFTLPIRCLAFSITGGLLASAGDDDEIKLIATVDNSIVRVFKGHQAPVVSLAFDPKNDKLASVDSDGTVIFWDLGSGAKIHCLSHAAPDVSVEEAGKNEIAWNPSGDVLAVPGHKFDVVMYDRETAEVQFRLKNCHNTAIGCLAWSPNGKYLATAGQDRKVMIWDTESKLDLDRLKVISQVTGLSWKPTGNALALIDVDGKFGVWEDAIPAHLPSPSDLQQTLASLSRQEILHFSDNDALDREDSGSGDEDLKYAGEEEPLKESDVDNDEEREGEFPEIEDVRESKKSSVKESKLLKGVSQLNVSSSPSRVKKEKNQRGVGGSVSFPRYKLSAQKPRPEKQAAFQPGSTQSDAGRKRFLAYSLLGCITSFETDGVFHVEVEFHDTSRGHRMPAMTDFNGFTMAALSEKGSILANLQKGGKAPSTLVYRPCSSWASNSEWSMRFPLNEEVRAVAVGDRWAASATSLNYLRIYSESGLQKYVLSLIGPVVTMTSHQQLLAVVTHASDPLEGGEQVMDFKVFHVCNRQQVLSGALPLTPGAKLAWLGFSECGTLTSYDSKGVLRMYSKSYGGCWIPVFGLSAEQESDGDYLWVVGLNSAKIFCVKCEAPDLQPQVNPRPVLSMVNFSMPLAQSDLGAADLENDLLFRSVLLAETRSRADEAAARGDEDDHEEDQLLKMEAELDRSLLRLIAATCQGDKLARALELATMLSLHKSLEGAVKIVAAMHLPSLAERLNTMLEGRRKMERSAAVAQASRRTTGLKQSCGPRQSSAPRILSSLHASLPPPAREPVVRRTKGYFPRSSQPQVPGPPRPIDSSSATVRNVVSVKYNEKENSLQNGKPPHYQAIEPASEMEADIGITPEEPLDSRAVSKTPSSPSSKRSISSNPFAKASNSSNPSTTKNLNSLSSGSEVSLLDSLKQMQKKGTDGKKKRKAKLSSDKPIKPPKASKETD